MRCLRKNNNFASTLTAAVRFPDRLSPLRSVLLSMLVLSAACVFTANAQVCVGDVQAQPGSLVMPWIGPVGFASDTSGNIYVADYLPQSVIKRIAATTHTTTTYLTAACGISLTHVQGLYADSSNNLYIANQGGASVIVYNITTGTCVASYVVPDPVAGTGPGI